MGLLANLSTAQMVEQLVEARRWLATYTRQQQQQSDNRQKQQQQQLSSEVSQLPADNKTEQPAAAAAAAAVTDKSSSGSSSSSSSSSSGVPRGRAHGKQPSWPTPPPRINNIVFMGMVRGSRQQRRGGSRPAESTYTHSSHIVVFVNDN
jgi:hypothetical protein